MLWRNFINTDLYICTRALPRYLHKHLHVSVAMQMSHSHMRMNIHMFVLAMRFSLTCVLKTALGGSTKDKTHDKVSM